MVGIFLVLLYFALALGAPLFYIIKESFLIGGSPSLENFKVLFSDDFLVNSLHNSWEIASEATIISFIIALPLALLFSRYEFRFKRLFEYLLLFPLFLPPFVGAMGIQTFLGRSGVINESLRSVGLDFLTFDMLGQHRFFGIALVQAIHFFPMVLLGLRSSLSRLNADLEDAALLTGASRVSVLLSIIFPLLTPALVTGGVLVFVGSFTDIGTPLLFEYRENVAVVIFSMVTDVGGGGAGFALITLIATLGVAMYAIVWLVEYFVPVQMYDKGFRPRVLQKERSFKIIGLYALLVGTISISLLGHLGVVLNALSDFWFMTPLPTRWTASHLKEVFHLPLSYTALSNSLWLSFVATLICVTIGAYIAWLSVRRPSRYSMMLNFLGMLPLFIPGVVCAYGYTVTFSGTPIDNKINPFPLLILAYSLRKLPFVIRLMVAGIRQISVSLEEAGLIHGASSASVMGKITLPLLSPHLIAAAVLCFLGSLLEVSDSLLLPLEEQFYPITKAMFSLQARPDGTPVASALGLVIMVVVCAGGVITSRSFIGRKKEVGKT